MKSSTRNVLSHVQVAVSGKVNLFQFRWAQCTFIRSQNNTDSVIE